MNASAAGPDQPSGQAQAALRCGYVALVGRPNVGKSTLLNRMLGQKVSIVSPKPQTTRQQVAGIKTTPAGQVIYLDTPGIHSAGRGALNRYMNRIARASLRDVDAVLFLVEAGKWMREDEHVAHILETVTAPVILVVNKIDLLGDKRRLLEYLDKEVDAQRFRHVLLVSARSGNGVDRLESQLLDLLPFSRPLYDEDQITDRSERFLAAELVREQAMLRFHQEVPYALTVEIEEFRRERSLLRISAIIWVEREGQKQIVIGKGGQALKQVGSRARVELEKLFGQKVFLSLWVRVSENWSDSERSLSRLGFDEPAG